MAEQTVRIMCPSLGCRKILAVPSTSRGKTVKCKSCGGTIRVPHMRTEPPPAEAAPAPAPAAAAPAAGKPTK